jgi:nitrite reductase/ring-hydroxylating ferredoxin subunit
MIAVMKAAGLKAKPVRIWWNAQPIVVFRTASGVSALLDVCPHRQAPFSQGRVCGEHIECPYHGWTFDADGVCRTIPGHMAPVPRIHVPAFRALEYRGLIFLGKANDPVTEPYVSALWGKGAVCAVQASRVASSLIEVAENILDATHTHFVHKGLLRGLSDKRYRVRVTVSGAAGRVEAHYEGEDKQEGLVSRLLEGERSTSVGRFIGPGIVELEFRGSDGINLCTTFHLREAEPGWVEGLGLFSGPWQGGLGLLKGLMFMPLFNVGLKQDQFMLSRAQENRRLSPGLRPVIGPLDILRPHIEAILAGEAPSVADQPQTVVMAL